MVFNEKYSAAKLQKNTQHQDTKRTQSPRRQKNKNPGDIMHKSIQSELAALRDHSGYSIFDSGFINSIALLAFFTQHPVSNI
jgi:hypothetical protein